MKGEAVPSGDAGTIEVSTEVRRQEVLFKAGALQAAIFNSANFSSIATDERGVIQIFNLTKPIKVVEFMDTLDVALECAETSLRCRTPEEVPVS